jgi:hypothetical protein
MPGPCVTMTALSLPKVLQIVSDVTDAGGIADKSTAMAWNQSIEIAIQKHSYRWSVQDDVIERSSMEAIAQDVSRGGKKRAFFVHVSSYSRGWMNA